MQAVLPPPEEEKDVKTAIGATRAQKARGDAQEIIRPSGSARSKPTAGDGQLLRGV
jgi:hypothetical protein